MTAFAPVFSPRIGCQYRRPKKALRTKTMLTVLARVGFLLAVSFIGGASLGLISLQSKTPRFAETALSLHQTQHTQDNSAVAVDSVSLRAARVVAAKRKASPKAAKRAAKLSSASRFAGNFH
jgi:hypothetical protein